MALDPLHQFEVHEIGSFQLFGHEIVKTNQSLWMVTAIATVILIFTLGARKKALIPGRLQAFVELTYDFVAGLVRGTAGKEGMAFFPLILTLFLFIASLNVAGMIPGSYTSTSQIFITGQLALMVFALVWIIGLYKHGLHFFSLFCPAGTPIYLAPLIIPLELISFFARPLTLAVRLAANMIAGHVLMKVFATFAVMLAGIFLASAALPTAFLIALTGLEMFIAVLQAYIFTVLTCVYLNDALHLH